MILYILLLTIITSTVCQSDDAQLSQANTVGNFLHVNLAAKKKLKLAPNGVKKIKKNKVPGKTPKKVSKDFSMFTWLN